MWISLKSANFIEMRGIPMEYTTFMPVMYTAEEIKRKILILYART